MMMIPLLQEVDRFKHRMLDSQMTYGSNSTQATTLITLITPITPITLITLTTLITPNKP